MAPISAMRCRSVFLPSMGVLSILKSPDDAHGSGDGERARSRHGVRHLDELHLEAAHLHLVAGLHAVELRLDAALGELALQKSQRESGAVDGHFELVGVVRQRADVILMTVSEDDAAQLLQVVADVGDVGDDGVDAGAVLAGELHAAVHDDDVVAELEGGHILADLTDAAQKHYFYGFCHFSPFGAAADERPSRSARGSAPRVSNDFSQIKLYYTKKKRLWQAPRAPRKKSPPPRFLPQFLYTARANVV